MENAVDALKMAGSVLLFVMALSICVVAFSQARESIDVVLAYSDRESLTIENDSRFYYLANDSDTNRYVGKETIIPAIYRAYKESYKIVFKFKGDYYLFEKDGTPITTIDLEKETISNDEENKKFLNGIIYGQFDFEEEPGKTAKQKYEEHFGIKVNNTSLFEYLNGSHSIKEYLGTYHIEDVGGTATDKDEVDKKEKRVITYDFT